MEYKTEFIPSLDETPPIKRISVEGRVYRIINPLESNLGYEPDNK